MHQLALDQQGARNYCRLIAVVQNVPEALEHVAEAH
jgi:hypothetical protein